MAVRSPSAYGEPSFRNPLPAVVAVDGSRPHLDLTGPRTDALMAEGIPARESAVREGYDSGFHGPSDFSLACPAST
jgi:hypothetical protein